MRWVDVCGYPGSGKSALCDGLWHPHAIEFQLHPLPKEWFEWWQVVISLLDALKDHRSFDALKGMTYRSYRKMLTVYRYPSDDIYIQTGLAQRGLGFGWRLHEQNASMRLLRDYFRLMPVSLGVVAIDCLVEVAIERNKKRLENQQTAHENRDFMVPHMVRPREILIEEMEKRGVPLKEIDTTQPIEKARDELKLFAAKQAALAKTPRSDRQMAAVL